MFSAFLLIFLIVNSTFGDITLFVSETHTTGNGGTDLVNFNNICQTEASNAGLVGTWNVLISYTGNRAYDSLPSGKAIKNVAQEQISASRDTFFPATMPGGDYLEANILHPDGSLPDVNFSPTASGPLPGTYVWSGGSSSGTSDPSGDNCNNWSGSGVGTTGELPVLSRTWWYAFSAYPCNSQLNIYCFSTDYSPVSGKNVYVLLKDGFKETGWVDGFFVPFWDTDSSNRLFTITSTDVDASSDPSNGDTYTFQNPDGDGLKCNRVACWFGESADTFELELVSYDDGADMTIGALFKGDKYLSYSNGKFSMQSGRKDASLFKF